MKCCFCIIGELLGEQHIQDGSSRQALQKSNITDLLIGHAIPHYYMKLMTLATMAEAETICVFPSLFAIGRV